MKDVYDVAGITRQAHSKEQQQRLRYELEVNDLVIQADALRAKHPGCGVEKMYKTLQPTCMGRDKFIDVMMGLGYRIKQPVNYRRTTISGTIYYPNLIEGMAVTRKNQVWQSDLTYIETGDKFCYLTMIKDVYTREIVGYAVTDHMRAEANMDALKMAFKNNPNDLTGLIHHSDRGSQYVDKGYQKLLSEHGILPSMGLIAQENAYAERVNGTIKNEFISYRKFSNLRELKQHVKRDIDYYNTHRIHDSLPPLKTPSTFAKQLLTLNDNHRPVEIIHSPTRPWKTTSKPQWLKTTELPRENHCPVQFN